MGADPLPLRGDELDPDEKIIWHFVSVWIFMKSSDKAATRDAEGHENWCALFMIMVFRLSLCVMSSTRILKQKSVRSLQTASNCDFRDLFSDEVAHFSFLDSTALSESIRTVMFLLCWEAEMLTFRLCSHPYMLSSVVLFYFKAAEVTSKPQRGRQKWWTYR